MSQERNIALPQKQCAFQECNEQQIKICPSCDKYLCNLHYLKHTTICRDSEYSNYSGYALLALAAAGAIGYLAGPLHCALRTDNGKCDKFSYIILHYSY